MWLIYVILGMFLYHCYIRAKDDAKNPYTYKCPIEGCTFKAKGNDQDLMDTLRTKHEELHVG